jgi:hypothetical protein
VTTKMELSRSTTLAVRIANAFVDQLNQERSDVKTVFGQERQTAKAFRSRAIKIDAETMSGGANRHIEVCVLFPEGSSVNLTLTMRLDDRSADCTILACVMLGQTSEKWHGLAVEDETGKLTLRVNQLAVTLEAQ